MKNKIAVRTEFFKKTQAASEIAHVLRNIADDKNVLPARAECRPLGNNFGVTSEFFEKRWFGAKKAMPEATQNTLIDSVLVLPLEQIEALNKSLGNEKMKKKLGDATWEIMKEIEEKMGFTPLGFKIHLDEGHFDENGKVIINPHAHMLFANVCTKDITYKKTIKVTKKDATGKALRDPKNSRRYLYERDEAGEIKTTTTEIPLLGRSPLSLYNSRGSGSIWSMQQDIAAKHLRPLGFERGVSKELTNRKNKSKKAWVASQAAQMIESMQKKAYDACKEYIDAREDYLDSFRSNMHEDKIRELNESLCSTYADLPPEFYDPEFCKLQTEFEKMSKIATEKHVEVAKEAIDKIEKVKFRI
jgi:hypothetical protein